MKKKIIELFVNAIKMNRDCEIQKQVINDIIEFEPYAVFTRIDRAERGCIDSRDIIMFLKDNGVREKPNFFKLLMDYYDRDGDSVLGFEEFLHFILPNMTFLRSLSTQKRTMKIPFNEYLTNDLEKNLTELFIKQAKLLNYVNTKKLDILHDRPNLLELFKLLDHDKDGVISFTDIDLLFRNHKLVLYEEEILSLIRLYDEDGDKAWNWDDFLFMILPKDFDANLLRKLENENRALYRSNPWENNLGNSQNKRVNPPKYSPGLSSFTTNSRSPVRQNKTLSPRNNYIPCDNDGLNETFLDSERRKKHTGRGRPMEDPLGNYGYKSPRREISPKERELIMKYDSPRRDNYYVEDMYQSPRVKNDMPYNTSISGLSDIGDMSRKSFNSPGSSRSIYSIDPYKATKAVIYKTNPNVAQRNEEEGLVNPDSIYSNDNSSDNYNDDRYRGPKKAKWIPDDGNVLPVEEEPEVCCCCEGETYQFTNRPYVENSGYYDCNCCDERDRIIEKYKTSNFKSTGIIGGETKSSEALLS
jgi:Ca2+-binding EF-hand superfamily protein